MLFLVVAGVVLIALGEILTFVRILPWSQHVFPLLWYGYIFVVDALNLHFRGRSLIIHRRGEFLLMLPISAFYWYLFEWYNLVIQNWLYINTPPEKWLEIPMKIISFATVIPALYETTDLVGAMPWAKKGLRSRPLLPAHWRNGPLYSSILGAALSFLPLIFPRLFFWSVWLGLFFLLDPLNYWTGRPSLLRDWQNGELGRTAALLLAGYVCGFFWEFWNYWAYTKWIYTVPLPEMPHIFEMPALGFLGFGPFALETFAFWTLIWGENEKNSSIAPTELSRS